jgi:hypothetical protein
VLSDIKSIMDASSDRHLTLSEASAISGYSAEHLGRLIRKGSIPNAGRENAPRIRLRDLPVKAGHLPPSAETDILTTTSKRQVALSVVGRDKEATR